VAAATLSHYSLQDKLGEGGMGVVYRAHDQRLNRNVAVKVLPQGVAEDPERLRRFEREARAAGALNHPNILTVHELGIHDGAPFIVTELLEGESLREVLNRGPVPVASTLDYAQQIVDGLAAAHARGITHRDLKPENLFVTSDGRVKILDFGLAKLRDWDAGGDLASDVPTRPLDTVPGTTLGTPAYMSPEQVRGEVAGPTSDVFSIGVVLYEMLSGRRPFRGSTPAEMSAAILRDNPPPLEKLGSGAPAALTPIVQRCLEKRPRDRFASGHELGLALRSCVSAPVAPSSRVRPPVRWRRRGLVALALGAALIAASVLVASLLGRRERVRWARAEALPKVAELVADEEYVAAFDLAEEAEQYLPDDAMLLRLWGQMARFVSLNTEPAGAVVEYRDYGRADSAWRSLGRTPLETVRIPHGFFHWRIRREGSREIEMASSGIVFPLADARGTIRLPEVEAAPAGMVRVRGGEHRLDLPAHSHVSPVALDDYFLDRFEVTNREFKAFVGAAYDDPSLWREPFFENGRELAWGEAMDRLRDATGLHGPATWEAGSYPAGQDETPVTGVSWYEAAAYCESVGKTLPTIFHWNRASGSALTARIVPASNLNGPGPARVGQFQGLGPFGTYDMAGNAREWVWNASGQRRYILGGAWDDRPAMYREPDLRFPFERDPNFGFRCMKPLAPGSLSPPELENIASASAQVTPAAVSDSEYALIERLYSYDKIPLNATVERRDSSPEDWLEEKVSIDAAYGNERLVLHLFLPKRRAPPHQTVIYFPGSWTMQALSSDQISTAEFDFVVRSGRALCFPIYKGTYQRSIGRQDDNPDDSSSFRDWMIMLSKDLGRAIDYLESRPQDFNSEGVAYLGYSWGAALGAILPALEPRLRAAVLDGGGYYQEVVLPEADQRTFAPRIRIPVLMINGRHDSFFPVDTAQTPMFEDLGTAKADKDHLIEPGGHSVSRPTRIRATLDWLDRYQGEVQ
jgi:formylglycine-generating enzyme required for sulfatase activity/dienelactone hydrolase